VPFPPSLQVKPTSCGQEWVLGSLGKKCMCWCISEKAKEEQAQNTEEQNKV